jgi:hypothetical protein
MLAQELVQYCGQFSRIVKGIVVGLGVIRAEVLCASASHGDRAIEQVPELPGIGIVD